MRSIIFSFYFFDRADKEFLFYFSSQAQGTSWKLMLLFCTGQKLEACDTFPDIFSGNHLKQLVRLRHKIMPERRNI